MLHLVLTVLVVSSASLKNSRTIVKICVGEIRSSHFFDSGKRQHHCFYEKKFKLAYYCTVHDSYMLLRNKRRMLSENIKCRNYYNYFVHAFYDQETACSSTLTPHKPAIPE